MKSILNLEGIKKLSRENLKNITGSILAFCDCNNNDHNPNPDPQNPYLDTVCVNCF